LAYIVTGFVYFAKEDPILHVPLRARVGSSFANIRKTAPRLPHRQLR